MELRGEFVSLASQEDANVSELCRRFGISRKTGYKWLARGAGEGAWAMAAGAAAIIAYVTMGSACLALFGIGFRDLLKNVFGVEGGPH